MPTLQLLLQPSVPVSGMHVNCGNEGHPEKQLESFSVSTTVPVGEVGARQEPHQDMEKHHMLPTHRLTPFLGLALRNSIT